MLCLRLMLLAGIVIALSACAKGASDAQSDLQLPVAPQLNLSADLKQLRFKWAVVNHASYYKLLQNSDGRSGYTQLGGNLTATNAVVDIAVHRQDWLRARYIVEACNGIGCTASESIGVASAMLQTIGYAKASNTGISDRFGRALALSGDGNTLAVGAWNEASDATGLNGDQLNNIAPAAGAVYVFARSDNSWVQQAYVKASNTRADDHFAISAIALSHDGNTLVVGAPDEDSTATGIDSDQDNDCVVATPVRCATDSGAVYVYTRNGTTWAQQAYIKATNTNAGDFFGTAVALSRNGNILAVGAYGEDSNAVGTKGDQANDAALDAGAVYVYIRSDTTWAAQAYVKASNTESGDAFGFALALSGDGSTLAVGARQEDSASGGDLASNALVDSGAVYVYTRSGSEWMQPAYVKSSNPGANDQFGHALALSDDGNTLAVGAFQEDGAAIGISGNPANDCLTTNPTYCAVDSGAVYVYARSGIAWLPQAYIKASNTEAGDGFGFAVGLSNDGNALAVGAIFEDSRATGINGDAANNTELDSGAVYYFVRNAAASWAQQTYIKAPNTNAGNYFGHSPRLSGDGNTLVIGSPREDSSATGLGGDQTNNAAEWAGAVYIY